MRTILLGLDAFDPDVFEKLYNQGRMPNLAKYIESKRYARFQVSNPAQSEVSWTSIATGLNPGAHGLFDFVHRDPTNYLLYVSLLPSRQGIGGTHFVRPYNARTIFDQAASMGFPATTLWWPATFPARIESPVRTLPGLGTPDIQGRMGVGSYFISDPEHGSSVKKTPVEALECTGRDRYRQKLGGPVQQTKQGKKQVHLPFELEISDDQSAVLRIKDQCIELRRGTWSPVLELEFKLGMFLTVSAVTRVILTQTRPDVGLYFLPLQIHPLKSPWRYGAPGSFVKEVWRKFGPFLTLGWPQDTHGLEDGIINDQQFLELCNQVFRIRVDLLMYLLENFQEGILGVVFDTLDRIQHMFWKHDPEIVDDWYIKYDALVGRVENFFSIHATKNDRLVIVSDHGFANFDYKVHLNRWLVDHGYLESTKDSSGGDWKDIDWQRSKAYAIGLNGVYLNIVGREAKGQVEPNQQDRLLADLEAGLLAFTGPDGNPVVRQVWRNAEAFRGAFAQNGPDLAIGYSPGYRSSAETGLGGWGEKATVINSDHWGGDHCIDPQEVPGVVFARRNLENLTNPSYYDIPFLTIGESPDMGQQAPPPSISKEDEEVVHERLESLGYF